MTGALILPDWLIDIPGEPPKRGWGVRVVGDRVAGRGRCVVQHAFEAEDVDLRIADRRQPATAGRVVAAQLGEDEVAVGVHVGVEDVIRRQARGVGAARCRAGDDGTVAEVQQEGAAGVAPAGVGILAGRTDRLEEVPTHQLRSGIANGCSRTWRCCRPRAPATATCGQSSMPSANGARA
jgi:hypothetical protein